MSQQPGHASHCYLTGSLPPQERSCTSTAAYTRWEADPSPKAVTGRIRVISVRRLALPSVEIGSLASCCSIARHCSLVSSLSNVGDGVPATPDGSPGGADSAFPKCVSRTTSFFAFLRDPYFDRAGETVKVRGGMLRRWQADAGNSRSSSTRRSLCVTETAWHGPLSRAGGPP